MNILNTLKKSLRQASVFNPDIQVAPACVLWPDHERQWEAVIPQLQSELPELLVLGDYAPELRKGPAIWLRVALAGRVPEIPVSSKHPYILYLPGVSRQELRAIEDCPQHLKPLAELQNRGVIWSQANAKDWTIMAYLVSEHGGLKLDVAKDAETKVALHRSLHRLLDEELNNIKGKRIDRDYLNGLLSGGDQTREVLMWLDKAEAYQAERDPQSWSAFVDACVSQLNFNPETEGLLEGCSRLAQQDGPWMAIWNRFREAPKRYPNIPDVLRNCVPPDELSDALISDVGWPQWNDQQEAELERALLQAATLPAHQTREAILSLEAAHGERRKSVWAELGQAPLATALKYLARLATLSAKPLKANSFEELASLYNKEGWRTDDAVLRALEIPDSTASVNAVRAAIQAMYVPWLQDAARELQQHVSAKGYPMESKWAPNSDDHNGECILFVDGLRFDMARRLATRLTQQGYQVAEEPQWSALPSVTATAKPAVSPVASKICGTDGDQDFQPSLCETGQPLSQYHLRKLLQDAGWSIVEQPPYDRVSGGSGWHEFGDIDREGHAKGWKLAKFMDGLVHEISGRITELLAAGWQRVRVVTDHGWLLMPGGLPKVELPSVLTENKWGRCAILKPGASCDERLYPWYWNPHIDIALADGIGCFKRGVEYAHGGLSLQECYTLQLIIKPNESLTTRPRVSITDVIWRGLRCHVVLDTAVHDVSLDIRLQAAVSGSSVVTRLKNIQHEDTASVIIEDDALEGTKAVILLMDQTGRVITELKTTIGGD
ncbi:MAG: BREX-1 system phosphatase PglZ type B [Balneolales bacterium]|nr:BREX-1 system phosphatase PglZ type B [Balneolales bacterium]